MGQAPVELVIVNGRVFAGGDPRRPEALPPGSRDGAPSDDAPDAVAVSGGRIAWVGRTRDANPWRDHRTEVIDAGGGLVGPGFEDAHLHLTMGARSLAQVDLQPARTIDQLAALLAAWGREHPAAEWIVGRGWHYGTFPGGMPDRAILDRLVPDRPALLECFDGHTHWANSLALARAGVTEGSPDPAHGTIERDRSGRPTGILKEFAHELFDGLVPEPGDDEMATLLRSAIGQAQRRGLTAIQEAWTELEDLRRYARARRTNEPAIRLRVALPADAVDWQEGIAAGRRRWAERLDIYSAELALIGPDEWLAGGIVKAFADGVIESGTAWMLEPYEARAGVDEIREGNGRAAPTTVGRPTWTPETLAAMTTTAVARGWQVEIHAIGDAAIRAALDAHERTPGARGRVEHVEWPHPDDVARFGPLGLVASVQPTHASPVPLKQSVRERWIGARIERGWPWASLLATGGVVAFGSDWPIATIDPLAHLRVAVTRQDEEGRPPGGWLPEERLTVAQGLACATWGSAYAARAEASRGTIAPGRSADLVVLDRDLLAEGPLAVSGTTVRATIVGGRVVYRGP